MPRMILPAAGREPRLLTRALASAPVALVTVLVTALAATVLGPADPAQAARVDPPPTGAILDYQLGGPYTPNPGVGIVVRDRTASPEADRYNVCYINGFQTQPHERRVWPRGTLLTHRGALVRDPNWRDEILLDTSDSTKRERIGRIMTRWIAQCARKGYQAVEFDNLDSYLRSKGELKLRYNIALATRLTRIAHRHGLAVAQKNTAEHSLRLRREVGFDFAVTESCARWDECTSYRRAYGTRVLDIEYTDETCTTRFLEQCARPSTPRSMILRDRDLRIPGQRGYRFLACPA